MAFGFDRFAFARGEKIFSFQAPEAEEGDGHVCANGSLDDGGFFDVEMARDSGAAGGSDWFAERHWGGTAMPEGDGFGSVFEPIGEVATAESETFGDPRA